jgi:hypothetical protein
MRKWSGKLAQRRRRVIQDLLAVSETTESDMPGKQVFVSMALIICFPRKLPSAIQYAYYCGYSEDAE